MATIPNLLSKKSMYNMVLNSKKNTKTPSTQDEGEEEFQFSTDPLYQSQLSRRFSMKTNLPSVASVSRTDTKLKMPKSWFSRKKWSPRLRPIRVASTTSMVIADPSILSTAPSQRQRLAFYLDTSRTGRVIDVFDMSVSLAQCILYVVNTLYVAPSGPTHPSSEFHKGMGLVGVIAEATGRLVEPITKELPPWIPNPRRPNAVPLPLINRSLELCFASTIALLLLFRCYVAPNRPQFIISSYACLSIIAALPVVMAHVFSQWDVNVFASYMSAGILVYVYPFRWARLHDTISIVLTPVKDPLFRVSPVARKAGSVTCAILLTLLSVTAFIHIAAYKVGWSNFVIH
jgi:hypothetical protein